MDKNDISEKIRYWLFIVHKKTSGGHKLWDYCKKRNIAAMWYQDGIQEKRLVTTNINMINKIKIGHFVVIYLTKKIVGCIGKVKKEFYEDNKTNNGFKGEYGQRIVYVPLSDNFEIDISSVWDKLSLKKKNLNLKTIHEISKSDFDKIADLFKVKSEIDAEENKFTSDLIKQKKQIILYGPPGTGKTFKTRKYSVDFIDGD